MDWPGEKLLIMFWETLTEKGIGLLLKPWQLRREGRAPLDIRREELLMLAQAERDAEDTRSGRKRLDQEGNVFALPAPSPSSLPDATRPPVEPSRDLRPVAQIVSNNLLADAIRREVNVSKALLHAEADLEHDPQEPPSKKVDDDWLFRWRDYASAVSLDNLQELWGRLLAGEVKSPGAFSLHTLEFLKNLSSEEANNSLFTQEGHLLHPSGAVRKTYTTLPCRFNTWESLSNICQS